MDTKLTLKLDETVIRKAKVFAQREHKSLSHLVENYFKVITAKKKETEKEDVSPLVKSLSGVIKLKEGEDVKEEYTNYLTGKYR